MKEYTIEFIFWSIEMFLSFMIAFSFSALVTLLVWVFLGFHSNHAVYSNLILLTVLMITVYIITKRYYLEHVALKFPNISSKNIL